MNVLTVEMLAKELELEELCAGDTQTPVTGCYCGDLLSWVMSRANSGDAWLTVMGNLNAVGVAALANLSVIILTEDSAFDEDALKRAELNEINVYRTSLNAYEAAVKISKLL